MDLRRVLFAMLPAHLLEQCLQRGVTQPLWQLLSKALPHLLDQVFFQLRARELGIPLSDGDSQVLGDLRYGVSIVRRHREAKAIGPALGEVALRATQELEQAR